MLLDPFDAGRGIGPVIHEVAEKQAGVERLLDGRQSGPVGMNVSQQQNFHSDRIFMEYLQLRRINGHRA